MARARRNGLRGWHRWLGLALALPLTALAVTGILLNHTDGLRLDERHAQQPWLLDLYGIDPVAPKRGYAVGERWISQARETLLLDAETIGRLRTPRVAAMPLDGMIAVVARDHVRLILPDGRLVERAPLPEEFVPVRDAAHTGDRLLLQTPLGHRMSDSALVEWRSYDGDWPGSATPRPLPERLRHEIAQRLAAATLTWEKLVLDLHSGRLFGRYGPLFMDALAVVLIALAITGGVLWWRSRPRP